MRHASTSFSLILALLLSALLSQPLLAQDDVKIELFDGGQLDATLHFRSALLTGPGIQGAFTGFTAPVSPDPFIVFGNPAALCQVRGNRVAVGFSPQLEAEITDVQDPAPTVKQEVDAALESFRRPSSITYPTITGRAGFAGAPVSGLAIVLHTDTTTGWFGSLPRLLDRFAIGYYRPLHLESSLVFSGMRMRLKTLEEEPLVFYSSQKMNLDLSLIADSWAFSGARRFGNFSAGLGVTRTDIGIDYTGQQRTDGIIKRGGREWAFNDPSDDWNNNYFNQSTSQLEGVSWGYRFGFTYNTASEEKPNRGFLLGMDVRLQTQAVMDGPLTFELNNFKAMNLNAGEGEKKFDVNRIENSAQMNETKEKSITAPEKVKINIPSAVSASVSWLGFPKPTLTCTKYFGELSYTADLLEEGVLFSYKRGFKTDWSALVGVNLGSFYLAAGALQIVDLVEGYHDVSGVPIKAIEPTILPRFSMGFDWALDRNITLGTLIAGLPEDLIRFTLKMSF